MLHCVLQLCSHEHTDMNVSYRTRYFRLSCMVFLHIFPKLGISVVGLCIAQVFRVFSLGDSSVVSTTTTDFL